MTYANGMTFPTKADRLYLIGLHPGTRENVPWDDEKAEYWTLNEAYKFPFLKRYDRLFQMHPRWDFSRANNLTDPNHVHYLQNVSAPCILCKGTGRLGATVCPECENGVYTPPASRSGILIYMQKAYDDIPGSVELPLDELSKMMPEGKPYFTSTFSYMLGMGILMGFPEIKLYGFEMASDTEYHYQRVCAEYWIGYARGRGISIEAPGASILKGDLYGYVNIKQGLRQQMEIRLDKLKMQLMDAIQESNKQAGAVVVLSPLKDHPAVKAAYDIAYDANYKGKGFVSFLKGAIRETENLISLLDDYFVDGNDANPETQSSALHIALKYSLENSPPVKQA